MPDHVEALPSRRDGVHVRNAGGAIEQIATIIPGHFARCDVLVREGSLGEGNGVIIPGDYIGAVGLGGHRGRVGEHVGGHLLLGTERHQLSRAGGVAGRAEPRRGEEQEEHETSPVHEVIIPGRRTGVILFQLTEQVPPKQSSGK
jgi:hypothetical protein